MKLAIRALSAATMVALGFGASAQVQIVPLPAGTKPSGVFNAFPAQNLLGPVGPALQTNYPYPGQCLADAAANGALFPGLAACPTTPDAGSFAPFQRSAGSWVDQSGVLKPFRTLNPILPTNAVKFQFPLLNPPDYTPDRTTFPGADYYEIGLHEAWGFDFLAKAGLFPNPGAAVNVPNGMQWTGLRCNLPAGCACPADANPAFCNGTVPNGAPIYTPIWGVGQINMGGGPVTQALSNLGIGSFGTCSVSVPPAPPAACNPLLPVDPVACGVCQPNANSPATAWSANNYVATWPSISIRANRGTPVVVKWVNEFPNTHVLCPHPEAADWPCSIDRTFMGVKARIDPGLAHAVPPERVNRYGSPQQPDNSWVTHLHGGEIPPSTDGFAEKWFGNAVTAASYINYNVNPPFENPSELLLTRPRGNADTYTYPMYQDEATIWFHDHTLGKTHHNVIAGPAGFFPVQDKAKHRGTGAFAGTCPAGATCTSSDYTWLDPMTQPRNALGIPMYDLFLAVQDRSFNEDGSINFSNGLGQVIPPGAILPVGTSSVTPGVNPQVHPTWVPEYFGDHALVNGVLWPTFNAVRGYYRLRVVDGSDSRCYTVGFSTRNPAPGTLPNNDVRFWIIANDQGYLRTPVRAPNNRFTMCPGERYELLVNFDGVNVGQAVYMTNSAPAPFPVGIAPNAAGSPYAHLNVLMRFNIVQDSAAYPRVRSCNTAAGNSWNATWADQGTAGQAAMLAAIAARTACVPAPNNDPTRIVTEPAFARILNVPAGQANIAFPAGSVVRQVYLNERIDGVTLFPLGMQLNGVPFEYKVTETPRKGTREYWQFVNLTVDTHPMHPHLVKHQIVARQGIDVGLYKAALCGNIACQPGPAPGNEMQVVPDVNAFLLPLGIVGAGTAPPPAYEAGWKDASQAPPNMVTTIVADWAPASSWVGQPGKLAPTAAQATAPGTALGLDWAACNPAPVCRPPNLTLVPPEPFMTGNAACACQPSTLDPAVCAVPELPILVPVPQPAGCAAASWTYEDVTSGPYVWHCHINSHEDSEMMRTSLVVP